MPYHVELSKRAELDLERIFDFIDAAESRAAAKWFNSLENLIASLATLPDRGTLTDYDRKLRYLLYGNKPHIYRILYRINERSKTVAVRHIRHGARKPLKGG
jgi:plasmid stabilization system protein ParE